MRQEILRMDHISKTVNGVRVLDNLSLNLFRGEIVGIIGHSGSGKSTITQILAGMQGFGEGRLFIKEKQYFQFTPILAQKNRIFMIHKHSALIQNMSLAENIFIMKPSTRHNLIVNYKAIVRETNNLLERVGLNCYSAKTLAYKLSNCEQALILLCRALAADAQLIILDSALDNLSPKERYRVYGIIKLFHEEGVSFLITDRTPRYLTQIAERIFVIQNGTNLKTFYRDSFDINYITQLLTQRRYSIQNPRRSVSLDLPALQVHNLSFGHYQHISFHINRGEILSILDKDGMFTRALASALIGKTQPSSGEIFLEGNPIAPRGVDHAVRLGIGIIEHDALQHGIIQNLSCDDNCNLMILDRLTRHHVIQKKTEKYLHRIYNLLVPKSDTKPSIPVSHMDVHTQYRILLTRWKIYSPPVIICLNPCSMTDIVSRNLILKTLGEYSRMHMAVLILSSDPDDVFAVSDRIFLYENGKLISNLLGT